MILRLSYSQSKKDDIAMIDMPRYKGKWHIQRAAALFTWMYCERSVPWHIAACAILVGWRATRDRSGMRGVKNDETGRSDAELGAVPSRWAGCRVAEGITNAAAAGEMRNHKSTITNKRILARKVARLTGHDDRQLFRTQRTAECTVSQNGETSHYDKIRVIPENHMARLQRCAPRTGDSAGQVLRGDKRVVLNTGDEMTAYRSGGNFCLRHVQPYARETPREPRY